MANVGFLLGTQVALDALLIKGTAAQAKEGSFYLTSDTNRLYIGKADGSLSAVNEGVITVANVSSLPVVDSQNKAAIAGQFYYATAENILCVYNGQSWVQINSVVKNTKLENTVSADADVATITTKISQSDGATFQDAFSIKGAGGLKVTSTGNAENPQVTIEGDTFALQSAAADNTATITLKSGSGENDSSVTIKGGTNVTVTKTDANVLITSKDTKNQDFVAEARATGAGGGFNFVITDTDGTQKSAAITPTIGYGSAGDLTANFDAGKATLNIYSKTETDAIIQSALRGFNAMEYKGTIGTEGTVGTTLPTDSIKNGYTYLLSSPYNYNDIDYPAGTMVIATGTEGGDGFIPSASIAWTFVTGATADTTYVGKTTANGIKLTDSHGSDVMQIGVTAGTDVTVTPSNTDGSSRTQNLTVAHKAYGAVSPEADATQPPAMTSKAATYAIPVISEITTSNGHVTGIKTKTYNVTDTNAALETVGYAVAKDTGGANSVTVTNTVTLNQSDGTKSTKSGTFAVSSDSLTMAASGSAVKVDLVWGEF